MHPRRVCRDEVGISIRVLIGAKVAIIQAVKPIGQER
jgi:hypothetical protein